MLLETLGKSYGMSLVLVTYSTYNSTIGGKVW